MIKLNQLKPAKQFGPGYFIKEQMNIREWTQVDLAEILGVTLKHVNKILNDKQTITLEMAKVLGGVFETDPKYWINLDTTYRLWLDQSRSTKEAEADLKAQVFARMPIKDMVKKEWIPSFKTTSELEAIVLDFWGWRKLKFEKIDELIASDLFLTRKSEAFTQFNEYYKITWYQKARKVAKSSPKRDYNAKELRKLYRRIHEFTVLKNGISKFLKALHDVGVIFFVLPHLQKTYLDGAAFIFDQNPVVVYTGRYKRVDNFWFTIAHEIAHVLKHLKKKDQVILDNLKDKTVGNSEREDEANLMAAENLKHQAIMDYLTPHLSYLTTTKVDECSVELQIHQSIIIGKLAHEEKISYRNIHLYNENVLEEIPSKYCWK